MKKKLLIVFLFISVIHFTNNNILGKTIIESESINYYDYYTEDIYSDSNVIEELIDVDNTTENRDNDYIESIDDNTIYDVEDNISSVDDSVNNNYSYIEEGTIKNGWYKENGKKYYYENNKRLKNVYVDYIYLNSNGVAQKKIGNFSATLYGARAWANKQLNIRQKPTANSSIIGNIPLGGKVTILSSENQNTKYIKIKYKKKIGYVYSDYLYINLPDVIPDIVYSITNANHSIYKSAG